MSTSVDPNRQIFPENLLQDPDAIEDYFYQPLYLSLKQNLKLPKEEQSPHVQASTIKPKLCAMNAFLKFLLNQGIFINLRADEINRLTMKIQELCASLQTSIDKREKLIAKIKSETLITVKNFQDFGSSDHVKNINQTLKNMSLSQVKRGKMKINKQSAIDIYDYLMVSLTYFSCLRASNLISISLQDVSKITKHKEIDGAYVLVNKDYKVSMLYGAKIILLDSILYEQLKLYIQVYCPIVSNDSDLHKQNVYVFTLSRFSTTKPLAQKMDHLAISNAMTSAFLKANILDCSCVSCYRIKMSVLTEIVSLGKESIFNIASCFAKHTEKVCKKYYIQHYSEREAARLSCSCYNMYKPLEDIQKPAKVRKTAIAKAALPKSGTIKKWF